MSKTNEAVSIAPVGNEFGDRPDDLTAIVQRLRAENAALTAAVAAKPARGLTCKVSAKGALSLYGVHSRFPVTLYAGQWAKIAAFMPEILAFAKANAEALADRRE